jgi:hypothetical protein
MEHIAALLLIIGCSSDLGECRELPAPVPVFETEQECDAALPAAFNARKNDDARVFARCVFVDPAMHEQDAELVWDINPDGMLVASVEPYDASPFDVASNDLRNGGETLTHR